MELDRFSHLSIENAPAIKVTPPGPNSTRVIEEQRKYEGSAVSCPRGMPMAIKEYRGATIVDLDDNACMDMFGGAGDLFRAYPLCRPDLDCG